MFYIGEFSKMGKTTIKTLHHYDRIGLLRPAAVDGATGYRLYTTSQLVDLHRIQALRQAGLSMDEVAAVVGGADPRPSSRSAATASNGNSPRARTASRASHSCFQTKERGFPWITKLPSRICPAASCSPRP